MAFVVALLALWWHGPLLDLHIYRLGGQTVRYGGGDLYRMRDQATHLPFTYPPFAALVFAPLAVLAEPLAAVLITVLTVAAAIQLAGLVVEQFALPVARRSHVTSVLLIALLASEPVISTVLFGQVNLLLLALVAQAWFRPGGRWALVGLGLAAGIKLTPAIFILGLFVCGRWRDGLRAAAAAAATVLVGAVYLSGPTHTFFLSGEGFSDTRVGGAVYISNQSLNGLLWRLTGFGGQRVLWILAVAVVLAVSLWTARMLQAVGQSLLAFCTVALAGLLASPVSWTHHWVVAAPLAAALAQPYLFRTGPCRADSPATSGTPLSVLRAPWRLVLAGCWAVVMCSWAVWMVPRGNDVEYHQTFGEFIVGNAYLELAVLTVIALTAHALRLRAAGLRTIAITLDRTEEERVLGSAASLS